MNSTISTPSGSIALQVHALAHGLPDTRIVHEPQHFRSGDSAVHAGIVVSIGDDTSRFEKGDRVIAIASSSNTYSKLTDSLEICTEETKSCRIPNEFSFEQACLIGLSMAAASKALFYTPGLGLSQTTSTEEFVLVSGGDTSLGFMATQLLKMSGYKPIVTCSPGNKSMCESYGAAAVFDKESRGRGADIRVFTDNKLKNVIDCVADITATGICYGAIGSSGGNYVALKAINTTVKYTRRDVRTYSFVADDLFERHDPSAGSNQHGTQLSALIEPWLHNEVARLGSLGVSS